MIKASIEESRLAVSDYELVYDYILTGTWKSKMYIMSTSLDRRTYDEETISLMSVYAGGELVDIQIDGEILIVRHLNDCVITEIRVSQNNPYLSGTIVYAFNFKDMHIGIEIEEDGAFGWDSWAQDVEIDIDTPTWSCDSAYMSKYYDFNKDERIDVFDFIEAKRLAFESDKLSLDDVSQLQSYLLTGEWQNEMQYNVVDLSDLEYSPECVDMIISLSYGQLVDYHINGTGKIWLRFLNNCTIQEVVIPNDTIFVKVKDITLNEQHGSIISIGITAEDKLGWTWMWNYVEEEF